MVDSTTRDTSLYDGGRLGMEFYAHASQGSRVVDSYAHDAAEDIASEVDWGTVGWTLKIWDIVIPSTYYTTVTFANGASETVQTCNPVQMDLMVYG